MQVLDYFCGLWLQWQFSFLCGLYGTILLFLVYLVLMEFPFVSDVAA